MKKTRMLLGLAVVFCLLVALSGAVQAKTVLKCQLLYAPTLPILGESTPWLAEQIKIASGDEVEFKLFDPGKLVSPAEILESVSKGRIDAGSTAAGFWAGKIPSAPIFSSIPFGPEAPEYLAWMLNGNGLKLYQEMYDQAGMNVKVLPLALIPPESSGWYTKEIKSLDDLKGLKMRFYGLGGEAMQKLGVSVTMLPPAEIFPALEKGAIDATEFSLPSMDKNLGFYKIAKYNYFPGWHQLSTFTELLINKDVWNKMKPAQQKIIEMTTMATITWSIARGEATQAPVIEENAEKHGVHNMYWSPEFLKAFRGAWEEVATEQSAKDPFFKKVMDDLNGFRAQYKDWSRLGFLPRDLGPAKK